MGKSKNKSKDKEKAPKVQLENLKKFIGEDVYTLDLSSQERTGFPFLELKGSILLTKIDISNNFLESLPDNIGELDHLVSLNLCNNRLTSLPDSIGDLDSLKKLNLLDNELTKLPYSFSKLKALKWLNVTGNKFKEDYLSEALIGTCWTDAECRNCAKNLLARMADLSKKNAKKEAKLQQKRDKELEIMAEAKKAIKAVEKDKRRAAYKLAHQSNPDNTNDTDDDDDDDSSQVGDDSVRVVRRRERSKEKSSGSRCSGLLVVVLVLVVVGAVALIMSPQIRARLEL